MEITMHTCVRAAHLRPIASGNLQQREPFFGFYNRPNFVPAILVDAPLH
jgi:hypothetical protein